MSTINHESHLLSFGEFCAMYLFCWSNVLWPDRIPRMEEVFGVPIEIGPLDMEIWKLHSGIELACPANIDQGLLQRFGSDEQKARIKQFTMTNLNEVMETHCKEQRMSFDRHRRTITTFRDGLPKVRRALANVPTYMIFDDHEVTDDWYLSPIWRDRVLTAPLGKTVVRNGLVAYTLFQGWGNDPKKFQENVPATGGQPQPGPNQQLLARITELFPHNDALPPQAAAADAIDLLLGLDGKDPPVKWHYSVPGPRHLVQVLDCRTRRTYASRVSGPGNVSAQALVEQLPGGPLPSGIDVLVVVSSLTVLGTPVIDELIGPMLFRLFDLGHGNTAEMPGLNPDAIEAWPYDPNAFESLLKRLETYRRVVILSGDVHFATSSSMSYWKKTDTLPARFAQFISSGLQNLIRDEVPMASQYMAFMQHVIQAKVGIERLGWNTQASDLVVVPAGKLAKPSLRDRLRKAPVLLPSEGWPVGTTENPAKPRTGRGESTSSATRGRIASARRSFGRSTWCPAAPRPTLRRTWTAIARSWCATSSTSKSSPTTWPIRARSCSRATSDRSTSSAPPMACCAGFMSCTPSPRTVRLARSPRSPRSTRSCSTSRRHRQPSSGPGQPCEAPSERRRGGWRQRARQHGA